VPFSPLTADTSAKIDQRQVEQWRQMTATEKAALVTGLTKAVFDLARAGIRDRYPDASPREEFLRLAVVTLGEELATKAYPEIAALDLR
jgi:hypothetical protein